MLRIIVVEDDAQKLDRVSECLREAAASEDGQIDIHTAFDALNAKRLLRDNQYDLMVLDIAPPERRDEQAKPHDGIELLDEIIARDIYHKPHHIVASTAFSGVINDDRRLFSHVLCIGRTHDA